jgi:hypothetical protein
MLIYAQTFSLRNQGTNAKTSNSDFPSDSPRSMSVRVRDVAFKISISAGLNDKEGDVIMRALALGPLDNVTMNKIDHLARA